MHTRHILCVVLAITVLYATVVDAHIYLSSLKVNGQSQEDCLRPRRTSEYNYPIVPSVETADMKCGFLPASGQPAKSKCAVAAGSKIGLQWYHNGPSPTDDIIDDSHVGPCLVYLSSDNGATWFKIYEDGYDTATKTFCIIRLKQNRGYFEATIPADVAPGDYLMRGELIALHEAFKENGVQPYVYCAELTISGSGKAKPAGVAFPGAYKPTDPGILFNVYNGITTYPIPGPALYKAGTASNNNGNDNSLNDPAKESSGAGGKAAIAIVIIGLFAGIGVAGFFYKKNGHLFGYTLSGRKAVGSSGTRSAGTNYVAYTDTA